MKQFLKYTFATIAGIVITGSMAVITCLMMLAGLATLADSDTVPLLDDGVLVVKLDGEIVEHASDDNIRSLLGYSNINKQGLDDIVGAIDMAAETDAIKGIYIECGLPTSDYASLQEIRNAIERFKANSNGKFVVAYANEYTQGAYYVCSAADQVWINPEGMLDLHGIASQPMYIKDLLGKFGVKMKVIKVGTYKSATETYTEEKMSDANREQVTRYITGIWNAVVADISKSRKVAADSLNCYADTHTLLKGTQYLLQKKLVDKTMYADEVKQEIKELLDIDDDEDIQQVSCEELRKLAKRDTGAKEKIAVYYCEGSIAQTPETGLISGDAGIISSVMTRDLDKLAQDDGIKAVIIRINSGGGDAFASEEIWHSVVELRKKKPVVVSMGGMAASGAYYLSAGASWIVAQPTTLTGSIGIFGAFPDVSGLMTEKLGIKYDHVKTNKHSDFSLLQAARPFNTEEEAMLQEYINRGYELFCERVANGRNIPVEKVKDIAEGRVWIGTDALQHKLIDQLGGMPEATKKAAELAKVKEYRLVTYPEPEDWLTQLKNISQGGDGSNLDEQLRATLGVYYEPFMQIRSIERQSPIQARSEIISITR